MARKPKDGGVLIANALSTFKQAVADLKEATRLLDEQARQKRALATSLNVEAKRLEDQADEAAVIAVRLHDLTTA